jgi:glycosyltransferase domain-containing protein
LNRSHFLIKMMRSFRDLEFGGCLLIGDSSDATHFERTQRAIEALGLQYQVVHRGFPGLRAAECIRELVPLVQTDYALWMCDDDILVPGALEACVEFLGHNPDYSAAGGVAVALDMDQLNQEQVNSSWKYRVGDVEADSASKRLLKLLVDYSVVGYSLSRTEQFAKRFQPEAGPQRSDVVFATELLPVCMTVVQGKAKMLNRLFVVRQIHTQRYLNPDLFDWITGPGWHSSFQVFRDCLAEEITRQDGISIHEAEQVVKQALWSYLARSLNLKFQGRYARAKGGLPSRLRRTASAVPGLRRAWHGFRSFLPGNNNGLSLPALLRRSSPYHADFMPIYRAITTGPNPLDGSIASSVEQGRAGVH